MKINSIREINCQFVNTDGTIGVVYKTFHVNSNELHGLFNYIDIAGEITQCTEQQVDHAFLKNNILLHSRTHIKQEK